VAQYKKYLEPQGKKKAIILDESISSFSELYSSIPGIQKYTQNSAWQMEDFLLSPNKLCVDSI